MLQVIEERPNALSHLGAGLKQGLSNFGDQVIRGLEYKRQHQEQLRREALAEQEARRKEEHQEKLLNRKEQFEREILGRKEDLQKVLNQQKLQHQMELENAKISQKNEDQAAKLRGEVLNKIQPMEAALNSIGKMKQIRKKGNLGFGSSLKSKFGGETARDKGAYEQLGKSLISMSSTIPVRNQAEFEALAAGLMDASISDAEADGMLSALESLLLENMNSTLEVSGLAPEKTEKKDRPPLSSFHR